MSGLNRKQIVLFKDLPQETQRDFIIQFEGDFEFDPMGFEFQLKWVSYNQLMHELTELFGPNLSDELISLHVKKLAEDIKKNGLKFFPIGTEGIHRKLAHAVLGKGIYEYAFAKLEEFS